MSVVAPCCLIDIARRWSAAYSVTSALQCSIFGKGCGAVMYDCYTLLKLVAAFQSKMSIVQIAVLYAHATYCSCIRFWCSTGSCICQVSKFTHRRKLLASGACGLSGVCLSSPSYKRNIAPSIVLDTAIVPATCNLTYGSNFVACAAGVVPSLAKPCEPGATANDQQDGNITGKVVACPSAGCQTDASLCIGMCHVCL